MTINHISYFQLNPDVNAFQRKFVNEVRRCDEMERKLRYIEAEVNKDGVHIPDVKEAPRAPNPREIIDLEVIRKLFVILLQLESFLKEFE